MKNAFWSVPLISLLFLTGISAQENIMTRKGGGCEEMSTDQNKAAVVATSNEPTALDDQKNDMQTHDAYSDKENEVYTSTQLYALAEKTEKKLDIFDKDGQKHFTIPIDDNFKNISLSEEHNFIVTNSLIAGNGKKEYLLYNTYGSKLSEGEFTGRNMIISPKGMYGATSESDLFTGAGKLKVINFNTNTEIFLPKMENGVYMGARFTPDNSLIVIWNTQKDGMELIKLLKYDLQYQDLIKEVEIIKDNGEPINSAWQLMTSIQNSQDNRLFAFFAIDSRYEESAKAELPNAIIVFDDKLNFRILSSERVLHSMSLPSNELVCYTAHYASNGSTVNGKKLSNNIDAMIEVYNYRKNKIVDKTNGIGRNLSKCILIDDKVFCNYDVDGLGHTFDIKHEKLSEVLKNNTGIVPMGVIGKKVIRYSFKDKKHTVAE